MLRTFAFVEFGSGGGSSFPNGVHCTHCVLLFSVWLLRLWSVSGGHGTGAEVQHVGLKPRHCEGKKLSFVTSLDGPFLTNPFECLDLYGFHGNF